MRIRNAAKHSININSCEAVGTQDSDADAAFATWRSTISLQAKTMRRSAKAQHQHNRRMAKRRAKLRSQVGRKPDAVEQSALSRQPGSEMGGEFQEVTRVDPSMDAVVDAATKHASQAEQAGPAEFQPSYKLTRHASKRVAQRGLTGADVDYILGNANIYHAAGATIYYLRQIDIPAAEQHRQKRLAGTAIIKAKDRPQVITTWRNRKNGLRNIRHKLASVWHPEAQAA